MVKPVIKTVERRRIDILFRSVAIGLGLFIAFPYLFSPSFSQAVKPPLIVILNSYHQGDEWSDKEIAGFIEAMAKDFPNLVPSIEHLDAKRFSSEDHLERTRRYLSEKYSGMRPDLIVILDNPAFDLVLGWENGPFEKTPKVFAGINDFREEVIAGRKDITGVSEDQDLEGTIRLAASIHPNASEALLISDATQSGRVLKDYAERMKPFLEGIIRISFAGEGGFQELEERLRGLSRDSIVVIMSYVTDASGRTFTRKESTSLICAASPVPVYAMHETRLGHGIAGGVLVEGKEHGAQAAELALRILKGESPGDIRVEKSRSRPVLDHRALARYEIPERMWPKDALIINRPPAAYESHLRVLVPLAAIAAFLMIITVLLAISGYRIRRAQRAARRIGEELSAMLESYPESAILLSREGIILRLNSVAALRLGLSRADACGKTVYDLLPKEVAEARRGQLEEAASKGSLIQFEDTRGGRVYLHRLIPIRDERALANRVAVYAQDITEFREKEALLRNQNELLSAIRHAQEIFLKNGDPNNALEHLLKALVETTGSRLGCLCEITCGPDGGLSRRSLAVWRDTTPLSETAPGEVAPQDLCSLVLKKGQESLRKGEPVITGFGPECGADDSSQAGGECRGLIGVPLNSEEGLVGLVALAGRPQGYRGEILDGLRPLINAGAVMLSALRAQEKERAHALLIKEKEENYRVLFEGAHDAILVLDKNRRIISCNKAFLKLFGYEAAEILGASSRILYEREEDFRLFGELCYPLVEKEGSYRGEVTLRRKDGGLLRVETVTSAASHDGVVKSYVAIIRDLTEIKRSEEERERLKDELMQAQKLEAVGTLAGGIAHDFNNILGIIMGSADLALMETQPGSAQADNLNLLLKAVARAKELVAQILTFSRRAKQDLRPLRLDLVVSEALKFLRAGIPSTIEIRKNIEKEDCLIYADLTQIYQVVMNLCVNAAHAMRERGGVLDVSVGKIDFPATEAARLRLPAPGRYCRMKVSDTGHGIRPEIINKIFDPYFTTKTKEEGTGLGLSVVKGIVEAHGGAVRVASEVGNGATFEVFLPSAEQGEEAESEEAKGIPAGHGERILLVDDEPDLLKIIEAMLKEIGYEVESRPSGVQALEAFEKDPGRYRLVITDMTMPGLTGLQLTDRLKKIKPDIPVVICTGFSEALSDESAMRSGVADILLKPVSKGDLAETAARALTGSSGRRLT